MKYTCIIVEDNAVERDLLEVLLSKIEPLEIVGIFENGLLALRFLQQHPVDLAFTDVDMPELSGIGLLKSLRQPPLFVFISAYSEYAADGYELDVIDFIRKPVTPERVFRASGKALERLQRTAGQTVPVPGEELVIRTSEGTYKMTPDSIAYAESRSNYSMLYLVDGTHLMVLIALKQLEEQLPQGLFLRIHKNYLVNWNLAGLIRKESVLLDGKYEVPIGDSYRKELADKVAAHPTLGRRTGR
jgi:DNA-binding LytR/AlgR family response regulator